MKAKDLIKILEKYPERDVKIHNGYVNDWLDVDISDDDLVKMKTSYHINLINHHNKTDDNKLTKEDYKNSNDIYKPKFEYKSEYVDYIKNKANYTFKPIFLIQGKNRGLSLRKPNGTIHY